MFALADCNPLRLWGFSMAAIVSIVLYTGERYTLYLAFVRFIMLLNVELVEQLVRAMRVLPRVMTLTRELLDIFCCLISPSADVEIVARIARSLALVMAKALIV
jgi:hypothetical protein